MVSNAVIKKRTWPKALLILAGTGLAVFLTLPIWFPWLLSPILSRLQVTWQKYDRQGYTRFALEGIQWSNASVRIEVARMELPLPTRWLWDQILGRKEETSSPLVARDWTVLIQPTSETSSQTDGTADGIDSTTKVLDLVTDLLPRASRWLPPLRATNGLVALNSNDIRLRVPSMEWPEESLFLSLTWPDRMPGQTLNLTLLTRAPFTMTARVQPVEAGLRLDLRPEGQGWLSQGELYWQTNRAVMEQRFSATQWWPIEASLEAENLNLPWTALPLPASFYESLTVSFKSTWTSNQIHISSEVQAHAPPTSPHAWLEPRLSLEATSDFQTAQVTGMNIRLPWFHADLTNALDISWTDLSTTTPASWHMTADLQGLPMDNLQGTMKATLHLPPVSLTNIPPASLSLSVEHLLAQNLPIENIKARVELDWPMIDLTEFEAQLDQALRLTATARVHAISNRLMNAAWNLEGTPPSTLLPEDITWQQASSSGEAHGTLTNLVHRGMVRLHQFSSATLVPVDASLEWQGNNLDFSSLETRLTTAHSSLHLKGEGEFVMNDEPRVDITWMEGSLSHQQESLLTLSGPAQLHWQRLPKSSNTNQASWQAEATRFNWTGSDRTVEVGGSVQWPSQGAVKAKVRNLELDPLLDYITLPVRTIMVETLDLDLAWDAGPLKGLWKLDGDLVVRDGQPLKFRTQMSLSKEGLQVQETEMSDGQIPFLQIQGDLPVQIHPGNLIRPWNWIEERPCELVATTLPNSKVWIRLSEYSGISLTNPHAQLQLTGTPLKPKADLSVTAEGVRIPLTQTNLTLPAVEQVNIEMTFGREEVRLINAQLEVGGEFMQASGSLPMGEQAWADVLQQQWPDWKTAQGLFTMTNASVRPLAGILPNVLTGQGSVSLEASLHPGGQVKGKLVLTNGATRPMPPFPPVRRIHGTVRFQDQQVFLEALTGSVGGSKVNLNGEAGWAPGLPLTLQLNARGKDLPLMRQPGMIFRGDIDISLQQTNHVPPQITGRIDLHDCLLLQDFSLLVSGGPSQPRRRPPFFSVTNLPFADWRLEMRVEGDKFLRVRSPVFRGLLSAGFDLNGTLQNPKAIGDVRIDSGSFIFPFGLLSIDQGLASLTTEKPYEPSVSLQASSLIYSYEVQMNILGSAYEPQLSFSSVPPLRSEEILLMLTAGEMPKDDVTFSNQEKAGRLAVFFARDLLQRLGADEGVVDRFTIRSGEEVSENGNLTYYIEYHLTDRWSIVGEYDRFNAMNAGMKWKIYSK